MAVSEDGTKTEVAMLFYMVMYGLQTVGHSHYRCKLQKTLHNSICIFYGLKECKDIEDRLREPVNQHVSEMLLWMNVYFTSENSMTDDIYMLFHPNKKAGTKLSGKKKETIYYTLPYNCPDEKMRVKRITAVMQMMQGWKWIEEPKFAFDFLHFFDGKPRNCNLKWIGKPSAILTELLKQLFGQHFMNKVKGVSARSIVMNQFGLSPSGNKDRIDAKNAESIRWIVDLLNYNKPLPLPKYDDDEDHDDTYLAAMQAVFSKDLHITKDLRHKYE